MLNLDLLVPREPADPDRVVRARILMEQASTGVGEKRDPIGVVPLDNGKFRVLDGNTTLQALRDMGETEAIVEIKTIIMMRHTKPPGYRKHPPESTEVRP